VGGHLGLDGTTLMARDRSPYGFLACALGAVVLGLAVFLPWYGVGLTASGAAFVQQQDDQLVAQFGNAALQERLNSEHVQLSSLAGRQLGSVSAHQAFKRIGPILLVLAGLGILIALISVARKEPSDFDGTGTWIALLGLLAMICVLYRMFVRPTGDAAYLALPLRAGAWLALVGSAAMIAGGLWPRRLRGADAPPATEKLEVAWSGLSGWTPEA
jgi:hypothetical protein